MLDLYAASGDTHRYRAAASRTHARTAGQRQQAGAPTRLCGVALRAVDEAWVALRMRRSRSTAATPLCWRCSVPRASVVVAAWGRSLPWGAREPRCAASSAGPRGGADVDGGADASRGVARCMVEFTV